MALKRYTASLDTTIANAYQPNLTTRATGANMGASDVLDVFSIYGRQSTSSAELSRILIKFPVTDISSDRTADTIPASGNVSFYLRMFNAPHSRAVPKDAKYAFQMVSQSWQEGVGLDMEGYTDLTIGNEGSNWMSASSTDHWKDALDTLLAGGSYHTYSGGSNKQVDTPIYMFYQTLADGTEDVEINITPWVEQWIAGTYSNHGIGVMLTASQEASGAVDSLAGRPSGRGDDEGNIENPSGSTTSYYIKRFFGRKSQYFFKRPYIEARWDDTLRDDRGNFYYSSSVASPADNLNTIYLYNYVRGQLKNIPGIEKTGSVMVSLFSGNLDDTAPTGSSGALLINSQSTPGTTNGANVVLQYFATGGWVSTGIYSASVAITASELATGFDPILTLYDVWSSGSLADGKHLKRRFHTGSIRPILQDSSNTIQADRNYLSITNLRNSYRQDETARFNLYVREKNWSPNIYTKANSNIETKTIHSASYRVYRILDKYRAVDYGTGSDNHTYLSYDVSGNYFNFDMTLLEPGYEYAFAFSFYDNSLSSWVEQENTFRFRVEKL
jgi:hypothetical protein